MNLRQQLKQWTDAGYVLSEGKGKYTFSRKFYDDLKSEELAEKMVGKRAQESLPAVVKATPLVQGMTYSQLLIDFIDRSGMPHKAKDGRGKEYRINMYNEKAAITLYKLIIREGVDYELLLKSTMLYYKSGTEFKKAIGNYIIDGDWRSDYLMLQKKASEGEESLKNHIKEETSHDTGNYGYSLG